MLRGKRKRTRRRGCRGRKGRKTEIIPQKQGIGLRSEVRYGVQDYFVGKTVTTITNGENVDGDHNIKHCVKPEKPRPIRINSMTSPRDKLEINYIN